MRNFKAIAAGSLIGLGTLASMPAAAEVEASVGVSTEYVFRGLEVDSPQVWGALDWSADSGLYAGTWISNAGGLEEVDIYGGYALEAGAVGLDFGVLYYLFPSQESSAGSNLNATEVYAGLSAGNFSGYLWIAPGGFEGVQDDEYAYLDLNYDIPLSDTMSIGTHVGAYLPQGDAYDTAATGTQDTDDAFFDFGISLNVGDFFIATTYAEESNASANFYGAQPFNASDNPSIIAGYSWSLPID
ncbi:hypothetical protein GYB61_02245 [bacterium]|nr:hypothetical protein [bacterium]